MTPPTQMIAGAYYIAIVYFVCSYSVQHSPMLFVDSLVDNSPM